MLSKTVGKVAKFEILFSLLFVFIESCPIAMQIGWKQLSVEKRAQGSDVVAVGKAIEELPTDLSFARPTNAVKFQLLHVLKGKNITNKIHENSGSSLFKIYGFGSPGQCLSFISEGDTYLLFVIFEASTMSLVAAYNSPFGATAEPTLENQDRVLASLGWRPWSEWSECSISCGGGWQSRTRERRGGPPANENRECNKYDCVGAKNLLKYFKFGRNSRSIQIPRHKKAVRFTDSGNLSVPTHKIFLKNLFPRNFTIFSSAKYVNYTKGYLISFHDSSARLQIGIRVDKMSVTLEYGEIGVEKSPRELAFNVEVIDRTWHQFAFSVQNERVSFYLDCNFVETKMVKQDGANRIDVYGDTYLNGKTPPQSSTTSGDNIEFYIEQLSFSEDARSGEKQCSTRTNDPYGYEMVEFDGSGDIETSSGEIEKAVESKSEDFFVLETTYTWSTWTTCSQSCGQFGMKRRVKLCTDISINRPKSNCQKIMQDVAEEPCNRVKCPAYCQQYCMNGGTCIAKNKCHCRQGYYGISCEKVAPCKRKCINGGRCIPLHGTCKCPRGFGGKYCEKASCYPPCQNAGLCVKPGVCKCRQGFVPPFCKPSCVPPCMNQGTCVMPGRCHCRTGYSGYRCQRAICTKPCLNGGRCYNRDKCICKSGWMGETCNIAICQPKCLNGGHCRTPNRCACPNETRGTYCQKVVCYPGCLNGGTCVKGNKCVCSSLYRGDRCQTSLCKPPCGNGGKCVAPNQCVCKSGYFGDWCERSSTEENTSRAHHHIIPKEVLPPLGMETVYGRKD